MTAFMERPRTSHASLIIALSAIILAASLNSAASFAITEGFDAPFRARPCLSTSRLSSCGFRKIVSARTYSAKSAKSKVSMAGAQDPFPSFDENEAIRLGLGAGTRPVVPGDMFPETKTTLVVPHLQRNRRNMVTMLLAVGVRDLSIATGSAAVAKVAESQRDPDQSLNAKPLSGLFDHVFVSVAASRLFQEGVSVPRLKLDHWTLPQPADRVKNAAATCANHVSTELRGALVKEKSFYGRLAAGLALIASSVEASAAVLFK